ncbi:MAG: class I SAM-dependent methyltransferase [Reichenbachiella sp.]
MVQDVHGQAILDYYKGDHSVSLKLHNSYGVPEEMPVEVFFREPEDFSEIENTAIANCRGRILDIGAAAGAHSLLLQSLEMDVTALDYSPGCQITMEKSGVEKVVCEDFQKHQGKYDTILVLMNGLGLAGTLDQIPNFLNKCFNLLNSDGQILIDSSDISYLYEGDLERPNGYFGEVKYQYEYTCKKGDWFNWVYVDQLTLKNIVTELGIKYELLLEDENDQYLIRLVRDQKS